MALYLGPPFPGPPPRLSLVPSEPPHPHQSGQRRAEAHLPRFSIRHGSVGAGEKAEREQCVSHTQPQSHVDELGGRGQQGTGKKPGIGQARSPRAPAEQDNSQGPLGCGGPSLGGAPRCKGGRGICSEKAPPCCGSPPAASCIPGPGVKSRSRSVTHCRPTKSGTDGKVLPGLLGTRALLKGGVGEDTRDPGSPASSGSSFWGWGAERAEPQL